MRAIARLVSCALLVACAGAAHAAETIRSFASRIAIQADGSLQVTETLRVVAEGDKIKRGIFRDFPTDYRDRNGQNVRVGFEVLGVKRGGAPEPWFTDRVANGVRVYIGDAGRTLEPGEHAYEIDYRTTRQLGFFAEHDELYWNVTGNGWIFALESVEVDVALPSPVPAAQLRMEGWTGYAGARGGSIEAGVRDGGAHISTTRPLAPEEGLTIAFTFPKGVIAEPTVLQRFAWWGKDNRGTLVALIGFALIWAWYLWRWLRYGRDPDAGVVIPEYEAPDGLPPSALRFVRRMAWDQDGFVADLLHMAQRGLLRIEKGKKKIEYELVKLEPEPEAGAEDRSPGASALGYLFATRDRVTLDDEAHTVVGPARAIHKTAVEELNKGRWFHRNAWSTGIGIGASLLVVGAALVMQMGSFVFAGFFAVVMLTGGAALAVTATLGFMRERKGRYRRALRIFAGLVLVALGGLVLVQTAGTAMFALLAGFALTNAAFAAVMPAYTPAGRRLLDRIEGFAKYLSVAEKSDLARLEPEMSGERYAAFLPYAKALDVEDAWSGKLTAALGVAAAAEATRLAVQPWYDAGGTAFSPSSFSRDVGSSLSSAISSSATPPGSSSGGGYSGGSSSGGGGGGGSSGGGGGGGGGGGW